MLENDGFTEAMTMAEELKLDRDSYEKQLDALSFEALKVECLKQYDLSGLSLDKYRSEYQSKVNARNKNAELLHEMQVINHDLDVAERTIDNVNNVIDTIKRLISLSDDYTHAMKRTTMTLIKDALNKELGVIDTILYRRDLRNGKVQKSKEYDDIPF